MHPEPAATTTDDADVEPPSIGLLSKQTLSERRCLKRQHASNVVRVINDELWACQDNGKVQVFADDLTPGALLFDRRWQNVNDVTALPAGGVMLAASTGLYLLSPRGGTKSVVDQGPRYSSCVAIDDSVFAYCCNTQRLVEFKLQSNEWKKVNSFRLPVPRHSAVSLATTQRGTVMYSCPTSNVIRELSPSGEVVASFESTAGNVKLCPGDVTDVVLVADKQNNCFQVYECISSGWRDLDLQPPVKSPHSAVVINDKLCVTSDGGNTLSLYESQ